jgi:hypothetical protein
MVYYCIYNNPPLVPVLTRVNPVRTLNANVLKIHLHIIILSTPRWCELGQLSQYSG